MHSKTESLRYKIFYTSHSWPSMELDCVWRPFISTCEWEAFDKGTRTGETFHSAYRSSVCVCVYVKCRPYICLRLSLCLSICVWKCVKGGERRGGRFHIHTRDLNRIDRRPRSNIVRYILEPVTSIEWCSCTCVMSLNELRPSFHTIVFSLFGSCSLHQWVYWVPHMMGDKA